MKVYKKYFLFFLTSFLMFNNCQKAHAISYSKRSKVLIGMSGIVGSCLGYKLSNFIFNKQDKYGFGLMVLVVLLSGSIAAAIADSKTPEGSFCDAKRKINTVSEELLNIIKETDNAKEFCDKVKLKNVNQVFPLFVEFELYQKLYNDLLEARKILLNSKELHDPGFTEIVQESALFLPKVDEYLAILTNGMQMIKADPEWFSMVNAKNLEESRIAQQKIVSKINNPQLVFVHQII